MDQDNELSVQMQDLTNYEVMKSHDKPRPVKKTGWERS